MTDEPGPDITGAVARVAGRLDAASIPFMLVGSVAALVYGHARSTTNADLVIDPTPSALERFVGSLDEELFYVSREAARDALRLRRQFNVIDFDSGMKIDLIVRKRSAFHEVDFERRRTTRALGVLTAIATPEDVILSKLSWGAASRSSRQHEDVRALVDLLAPTLDWDYLDHWSNELGVQDALAACKRSE